MTKANSKLLNKIQEDLKRAFKEPLLLEINHSELTEITQDFPYHNVTMASKEIVKKGEEIFDGVLNQKQKAKSSNLLLIDNILEDNKLIIYNELIEKLDDTIKRKLNTELLQNVIKGTLSSVLGFVSLGDSSELVTETSKHMSESLVSIFDFVGDEILKDLQQTVNEKTLVPVLEYGIEDIAGKITDKATDSTDIFLPDHLYLSENGAKSLHTLYNEFPEVSFVDSLRLVLRLFIAVSIDAPKLIIVKNPHRLDVSSLAIISKYFSLVKDNKNKLPILSFVFIYEDKNAEPGLPYTKEDKEKFSEKICQAKEFLDNQRIFLQRYGMLVQPKSDLPELAIPSSVFVGRVEERKLLYKRTREFKDRCKKNDNDICMIDVIQAEPGVGKTALYNQHIREFFEFKTLHDERESTERTLMLKLYIHNDNGMSVASSGLVSLVDSISEEYDRLEKYYLSHHKWKLKASGIAYDIATDLIFGKLKDLKNIINATAKRMSADEINNNLSNRLIDAGSSVKQKENKEEYFQKILNKLNALKEVLRLIDSDIPSSIILFIDDIHWLDDQSAKFIITRLLKHNKIRIIATARTSDANSRYKYSIKDQKNNVYKLAIFEKLRLVKKEYFLTKDRKSIDSINDHFISNDMVETYALTGFDKDLLSELIETSFKNTSKENNNYLAQKIISFLSNENYEEENKVVTLFAIEALNIISDLKFYVDENNQRIDKLNSIFQNIGDGFHCIELSLSEFGKRVDIIFNHLENKYHDAAHLANGNYDAIDGNVFNIGSYAILEERLHLLSMYFEERGEAIVQHILFSTILGTPFDSNLVSGVLNEVLESKDALLKPLQKQLKDHTLMNHNDLNTIENIYQIIYRLVELEVRYIYSHSLIEIFLERKMDSFFSLCYTNTNINLNKVKNVFYKLLFNYIEDNHTAKVNSPSSDTLTRKESANNIFHQTLMMHISKKGFESDENYWARDYISVLYNLAHMYKNDNMISKALVYEEKSLEICEIYYSKSYDEWVELYVHVLAALTSSYIRLNRTDDAIIFGKKSLEIVEKLYKDNPNDWVAVYSPILVTLASISDNAGSFKDAHKYIDRNLSICRDLYDSNQEIGGKLFVEANVHLAKITYNNTPFTDEAIRLLKDSLPVSKVYYNVYPEKWANTHIYLLNQLADYYRETNKLDEALKLLNESLNITEGLFENNSYQWIDSYVVVLGTLAIVHERKNHFSKAMELYEKAVQFSERYYNQNSFEGVSPYCLCLNNLALYYKKNNKLNDAISLEKKSLNILEEQYADNNVLGEQYANTLNQLALSYKDKNQHDKAIELGGNSLKIIESLYKISHDKFAQSYANILINLAIINEAKGYLDEALAHGNKSLIILQRLYRKNTEEHASAYLAILQNLAIYYKKKDRLDMAIKMGDKHLKISKKHYEKNTEIWAETYIRSLIRLSLYYREKKHFNKAIAYGEISFSILEKLYRKNPNIWEDHYIKIFNYMVVFYNEQNNLDGVVIVQKKNLEVYELFYNIEPDKWEEAYVTALRDLAGSYKKKNQRDMSIALERKSFDIMESLCKQNFDKWAEPYAFNLTNLATYYETENNFDEAIKLGEKSLIIMEKLYEVNPKKYVDVYTLLLLFLTKLYVDKNHFENAILFGKRNLNILEHLIQNESSELEERYVEVLSNLFISFEGNKCRNDAILFAKKTSNAIQELSKKGNDKWITLQPMLTEYLSNMEASK